MAGLAARRLWLLLAQRRAEPAGSPPVVGSDSTDVEVYGPAKHGVAYMWGADPDQAEQTAEKDRLPFTCPTGACG